MVDLSQRFTDWREQVKRTPKQIIPNWKLECLEKIEHRVHKIWNTLLAKNSFQFFSPKLYVIVPTDQDNERCEKGF